MTCLILFEKYIYLNELNQYLLLLLTLPLYLLAVKPNFQRTVWHILFHSGY